MGKHPILELHEAFVEGDLERIRQLLGEPADFPNNACPIEIGHVLEYAIYWSPLPAIRALFQAGADANYEDAAGFPCLMAALSTDRTDKLQLLRLLLENGADVMQRGVNDYTPLHFVAGTGDVEAARLLLEFGADPQARTRIDELESPRDLARARGDAHMLKALGPG